MEADSGQMAYVNFQNPTCPREFLETDICIFRNLLNFLSFNPIDMKCYGCILNIYSYALKL